MCFISAVRPPFIGSAERKRGGFANLAALRRSFALQVGDSSLACVWDALLRGSGIWAVSGTTVPFSADMGKGTTNVHLHSQDRYSHLPHHLRPRSSGVSTTDTKRWFYH